MRRLFLSTGRRLPARRRRGISLLEVLISIFVLLFGLLAVAAVIPVARLLIVETAKADRSAACGRAGLNEVKVRRMLDPNRWRIRNVVPPPAADLPVLDSGLLLRGASFAIDPLFVAATVNDGRVASLRRFPYDGYGVSYVSMWRVSLEVPPYASPLGMRSTMPFAVADRIFRWQDDLSLPVPEEDVERPRQMMTAVDGAGNPLTVKWPSRPADGVPASVQPIVAQVQGDYSWLVTVTPKPYRDPVAGELLGPDAENRRLYSVSVVVFYKRDLSPPPLPGTPPSPDDPPAERVVEARILGGGEARLEALTRGDPPPSSPPKFHPPQWLNVKKGEWLLLMANMPRTRRVLYPDDPWLFHPNVCQWYRIVSTGGDPEELPSKTLRKGEPWTRFVTLAGPDWPGPALAQAALFTGVIGVYTETMELDDDGSLWAH